MFRHKFHSSYILLSFNITVLLLLLFIIITADNDMSTTYNLINWVFKWKKKWDRLTSIYSKLNKILLYIKIHKQIICLLNSHRLCESHCNNTTRQIITNNHHYYHHQTRQKYFFVVLCKTVSDINQKHFTFQ